MIARTVSDVAFLLALALLTVGSGMLVGSTGVLRALQRPHPAEQDEDAAHRRGRIARWLLVGGGCCLAVAVVAAVVA